ncbi:MAG TPA: serine hydrolase domain-containing protein [Pseudonocardiaceae bacterium]|jgi:CubicO group peptidase (beta-lactamase class C family)|nr:serine hydrolase domain-containing protein [Pseudonocardiaceae bacterium]
MTTAGPANARRRRTHDVLAGYVDRGEIPGLVALTCRRGETHVDTIGTLSLGGQPVTRDAIFRISSMTKPVIAAATMILVEECVLRLDDPVDRWLPELADRQVLTSIAAPVTEMVPAQRPITVRDLLTFRMGFGLILAPPQTYPIQATIAELHIGGAPAPDELPEPDEWLRQLGTLPLLHQPGEKWLYGTGSNVLGALLARATGQALGTFLHERIFAPLGMIDTSFSVPSGKLDRFATSYSPYGDSLTVYDDAVGGQWSRPPAFPAGASGLVSTADDYLAFARMLLTGGGPVLSRASVALMTADQLTPAQKAVSGLYPGQFDNRGWGFGLQVVTRQDDIAATPGQYGWDGAMGTSWSSDPAADLVVVLMTQRGWTSPSPPNYLRDFRTSVYQALD